MPKLPKFSDLTDIQGMLNKVKSAVDNLMGPGNAQVSEETINNEKNPTKAKLLEIELLINQLHDVYLIQNKTIHALKTKYADIRKLLEADLVKAEGISTSSAEIRQETAVSSTEVSQSADGEATTVQTQQASESSPAPTENKGES